MFSFFKEQFQKIYTQVTSRIGSLFLQKNIDEATLQELETILLSADTGVKTTNKILEHLKSAWQSGAIKEGADLKKYLHDYLISLLQRPRSSHESDIYLLVGVNGSGKTTFAAKLAYKLAQQGKRVLLVAGDTFRAAATEQLAIWASKLDIPLVKGSQGQDPASVVFQGCDRFKNEHFDALIIDTAGRLQTKTNLMRELEKIKNILKKQIPNQAITTLLTIDSMLGQNSFEQARLFNESTDVQGIVLTKMDGTGKGGIVFGISDELHIPISFICFGENVEALKPFDAQTYVTDLLSL